MTSHWRDVERVLYAPNIHVGGGRTLMLPVLDRLAEDAKMGFVLDARLDVPSASRLRGPVYRVPPSVHGRWRVERYLRRISSASRHVLCLGSLPPMLANFGRTTVFIQNRYLVDEEAPMDGLPLAPRLRLAVERRWLRLGLDRVSSMVVQTPSMQALVLRNLGMRARILPLAPPLSAENERKDAAGYRYDFLYVASGEAHKNHRRLVQAWAHLAERGLFPCLCLTLDCSAYADLWDWICRMRARFGLKLHNLDSVGADAMAMAYRSSSALIYPSLFESFGLPLIEAVRFGLPVVAADKAYVYDVIEPSASFDPLSTRSMAEAVANVLKHGAPPSRMVTELLDAEDFLARLGFLA